MKKLFMHLMWFLTDKAEIVSLSLYRDSDFSDMDFEYEGKRYNITIREKKEGN